MKYHHNSPVDAWQMRPLVHNSVLMLENHGLIPLTAEGKTPIPATLRSEWVSALRSPDGSLSWNWQKLSQVHATKF